MPCSGFVFITYVISSILLLPCVMVYYVVSVSVLFLCFSQGYAWCRRHHVGWYSIRKPAAGGIFFSFTITKMGWESLSLMMVMRWDGKHEEMH